MTESVSEGKIVISAGTTTPSEKIAERNTVVYATRIEPSLVEAMGERIKTRLFTRFGVLKPRPEDIRLVTVDKYYEPYMQVSGKYFIDYYRKCTYVVKVDKGVHEIILWNQKFMPEQSTDSSGKNYNVLKLQGEERLTVEVKASLVLDRFGQEVAPRELSSCTLEKNPKEILAASGVKEIAQDKELDIIRSRIFRRPKDINRLITELFEVNERVIIYIPRYRVRYANLNTGEMEAVEFDGITAQKIRRPRLHRQSTREPI